MASHTERKCRAALVFSDCFSRIRKWESQKLLIFTMVASLNHCISLLSSWAPLKVEIEELFCLRFHTPWSLRRWEYELISKLMSANICPLCLHLSLYFRFVIIYTMEISKLLLFRNAQSSVVWSKRLHLFKLVFSLSAWFYDYLQPTHLFIQQNSTRHKQLAFFSAKDLIQAFIFNLHHISYKKGNFTNRASDHQTVPFWSVTGWKFWNRNSFCCRYLTIFQT